MDLQTCLSGEVHHFGIDFRLECLEHVVGRHDWPSCPQQFQSAYGEQFEVNSFPDLFRYLSYGSNLGFAKRQLRWLGSIGFVGTNNIDIGGVPILWCITKCHQFGDFMVRRWAVTQWYADFLQLWELLNKFSEELICLLINWVISIVLWLPTLLDQHFWFESVGGTDAQWIRYSCGYR